MRANGTSEAPPKLDHERRGRLVASLLVLGAALLAVAGPARAAPSDPPGVEITPSVLERDLPGRSFSSTVVVINHEAGPRRVTVSVTGLGNDLDGGPVFVEPSPAAAAVRVDPTAFVLAPEERREIKIEGDIPPPGPGLYAAVVAEYAPPDGGTGGSVAVRTRVATLMLLRAPRPWRETVEVVGVGVRSVGPEGAPLEVFAALQNTGDVHVRPTGTARLVKDGTVLATVPLPAANILPGYARRLVGTWTPPPGLTGTITVEVDVTGPAASGRGQVTFAGSVPDNPAAVIKELRAQALSPAAKVTLVLENTGTVALEPTVTLTATENGSERARTTIPVGAFPVGATRPLEWEPELPDGIYLIRAEARNGDLVLAEATAGLRVGAEGSDERGAGRSGRNLGPIIAVAVLLLLLVLVLLVLAARRRKQEEDQESLP